MVFQEAQLIQYTVKLNMSSKLCQFPNGSNGDRAWCKLLLDSVIITFKDVVEWYRTKSHIANELGLNVTTLETNKLGFPYTEILNVIKYAHFLRQVADTQ